MKIRVEDRRKVALAVGLLLAAGVLTGRWLTAGSPSAGVGGVHVIEKPMLRSYEHNVDPTLRLGILRETEATSYLGNGRNIFRIVEERRDIHPVPKEETKVPDPPKVVVLAPIPLSFFGFSRKSGLSTVFLRKGEDVFLAKEGDIVDRRYKIVRVTADSVEIEDLLSERSERLMLRRG